MAGEIPSAKGFMSNRSSARLEAGRKRKRIATSTRFMEISPGSAEMRLERTTQCSRLRHCAYIVDVLSANLPLGLCQGCPLYVLGGLVRLSQTIDPICPTEHDRKED